MEARFQFPVYPAIGIYLFRIAVLFLKSPASISPFSLATVNDFVHLFGIYLGILGFRLCILRFSRELNSLPIAHASKPNRSRSS